ncbi:MAG: glycosyltransferase family protein [Gemmatimonadota bacterium]
MRIAFTIQGQGRGHLTQAIAASEILTDAGHEIVAVAAGSDPGRNDLPESFMDAFSVPVTVLASPGFVFKDDRGVDLLGTLANGVVHLPHWWRSLRALRRLLDETRPDVVINFFEPLTGVLQALRPLRVPVLSAAHQFALLGPRHGAPATSPVAPLWLRAFIQLVGFRSRKLALSFRPDGAPTDVRDPVIIFPPLLRKHLLQLEPTHGDYVLVYVATHGYGELVRAWHVEHPDVSLHCFYGRPGAPAVETVDATLTFHQLDPEAFLEAMAGCRAVVCTAGFESICEAAYLGKPVLMIPLENHHEQELNARDGEASGVAIGHPTFDLNALERLPDHADNEWFRDWCRGAPGSLLSTLDHMVQRPDVPEAAKRSIA